MTVPVHQSIPSVPGDGLFLRSTLALLVAFLPLAFSEDLLLFAGEIFGANQLNGWALLPLDLACYLVIALLLWGVNFQSYRSSLVSMGDRHGAGVPYLASLFATLLLDIIAAFGGFTGWSFAGQLVASTLAGQLVASTFAGQLVASTLYIFPQALLYLSISRVVEGGSPSSPWRLGVPLLIGTYGAWIVGFLVWTRLEGFSSPGEARVDREYFAQMAQLLPVLLIALAVELKFFKRDDTHSREVRQAGTATVACITTIGVLAAILNLVDQPRSASDHAAIWGEYVAFVVTVDAVFVSLASFVWAIINAPRST